MFLNKVAEAKTQQIPRPHDFQAKKTHEPDMPQADGPKQNAAVPKSDGHMQPSNPSTPAPTPPP